MVCLALCSYAQNGNGNGNGNGNAGGAGSGDKVIHETKTSSNASNQAATNQTIVYHGGPVMTGTTNIYYIWYGNWNGNDATTILTDFAKAVGGSAYFNINTTYYNASNIHVSNSVHYAGSTTDANSQGTTNLSDGAIQSIVSSAISSGRLPKDANAVYFVLTAQDVTKNGFCTSYCGWHTRANISGTDIKYSFVGNPATQCPSSCSEQTQKSPNGNIGADAMASIIAHELEEAVTDPDLNAWYDRRGAENADKCAWTFGTTYTANGSLANVKLGTRDYLIQRNWVNNGNGFCSMSF